MISAFFRPATIIGSLPNTIANGQVADAVPLMADLNWIVNQVNANAAELANTPQLNAANTFTAVQSGPAAASPANFPIASQVQNRTLETLTSVVGVNTITARVTGMALPAYAAGQVFTFYPAGNNSGPVTIDINGLGAIPVGKTLASGLSGLASNDLRAGVPVTLALTSTGTRAEMFPFPTTNLIFRTKPVDQSAQSGNTTLQDETDLRFPVAPNEEWVANYFIDAGTSLTNHGLQFAVSAPSGFVRGAHNALIFGGASNVTYYGLQGLTGTISQTGVSFSSGNSSFTGKIYILNGANPGEISLRFAQLSSSAPPLTFRAGSELIARRVTG